MTLNTIANRLLPAFARRIARFAVLRTVNTIRHGDPFMFGSVTIETSTACNRRCSYCPVSEWPRPQQYIEIGVVKMACCQLSHIGFKGTLDVIHYNEPLIQTARRLELVVELMHNILPKALLCITTNGDKLTISKARGLMSLGVRQFNVTRHPPYSDEWDARIAGVMKALPGAIHFLNSPGDEGWTNRGGLVETPGANFMRPDRPCNAPENLVVGMNGDVLLCCNDYHKTRVMGNIMTKHLSDIWGSYAPLRRSLRRREWRLDMCKRCVGVKGH